MDLDEPRNQHAEPDAPRMHAPELVDAIVDALCQGRLTPAEIADLTSRELDALYALGAARLCTGQPKQAVALYSALVSLDPYQARAWRALGISHHHLGAMQEAMRAYAAALFLEPKHALTAVYALEVHLVLGHKKRAEYLARVVRQSSNAAALLRLTQLMGQQPTGPSQKTARVQTHTQTQAQAQSPIKDQRPVAAPVQSGAITGVEATSPTLFCLADGRVLPLEDSVFAPVGEGDETTLVYDLALLNPMAPEPLPTGEDASPQSRRSAPMEPEATQSPSHSETRTVTGASAEGRRVMPEATAARRMGLMLTQEITRTSQEDAFLETTEPAARRAPATEDVPR